MQFTNIYSQFSLKSDINIKNDVSFRGLCPPDQVTRDFVPAPDWGHSYKTPVNCGPPHWFHICS